MELCEGVEHIKSVHVNDSSVDCELRSKREKRLRGTTEINELELVPSRIFTHTLE